MQKHPSPAGQGNERVFLCPVMGAAGSLSDKIFPHGGEDVQQDAGLGADTAVLHAVLFQDGVTSRTVWVSAVHRELERTRHHIGDLGVGMMVECAHGPFSKVFSTHISRRYKPAPGG